MPNWFRALIEASRAEPLASMHFAPKNVKSCASCHNTNMAFGETFSDCKRCHTGENFKFR